MEPEIAELLQAISKNLQYTPIVYKQTAYINSDNFNNEYVLEYKHTDIPDNSLLFFVPSASSTDGAEGNDDGCKLIVKTPYVQADGKVIYPERTFDIIVEQNDDKPRKAKKGDIIANRMCIFRFRNSSGQVILCNSPLYNDAIFSNLKVTHASFINLPTYVDPESPFLEYTFVTSKELEELKERITNLENRIKFGTEEPEDALQDCPTGTIYVRYEE